MDSWAALCREGALRVTCPDIGHVENLAVRTGLRKLLAKLELLVEQRGVEPLTSALRIRRPAIR